MDSSIVRAASIAFLIVLISGFASADVVVNSGDWREVSIAYNYGLLEDRDVTVVNNLGQARLAPELVDTDKRHLVLESENSSAVTDVSTFLESGGVEDIETQNNFHYAEGSHSLFERAENDIEGFIVVNKDNIADTVSSFPKMYDGYWLLYYESGTTEEVLNSNPEQDVVFIGEFLTKPWIGLENDYEKIDNENAVERNYEIAERMIEDDGERGVQGSTGTFVENGIATTGKINLIMDDSQRAYEFLDDNGVDLLEIIGPESGQIGSEIRSASDGDIAVLVKTARTFTGNPQLSGQEVPLQTISGDPVGPSIGLISVVYDEGSGLLEFNFFNTGSETGEVVFTAAEIQGIEGDAVNVEPDESSFTVRSGTVFSKTVEWNEDFVPESADLLASSEGESVANSDGSTVYDISEGDVEQSQPKNLSVERAVYNNDTRTLELVVRNNGDSEVSVSPLLDSLNVGGDEVEMLSSNNELFLEPGESGSAFFNVYMTSEDMAQMESISGTLSAGDLTGSFSDERSFEVQEIELEAGGDGLSIGVILVLLFVFVLSVGYFKREEISGIVQDYR